MIDYELLKQLVDSAPDNYDRSKKKKFIPNEMREKIWQRDKCCNLLSRKLVISIGFYM